MHSRENDDPWCIWSWTERHPMNCLFLDLSRESRLLCDFRPFDSWTLVPTPSSNYRCDVCCVTATVSCCMWRYLCPCVMTLQGRNSIQFKMSWKYSRKSLQNQNLKRRHVLTTDSVIFFSTGWPICFGKEICWHQILSSVGGLGQRINLKLNVTSNLVSTYFFPKVDGPPWIIVKLWEHYVFNALCPQKSPDWDWDLARTPSSLLLDLSSLPPNPFQPLSPSSYSLFCWL